MDPNKEKQKPICNFASKEFAIKVNKKNLNLTMNLDSETNVGESVFNYKCLGHGCSKEFLTTNGRGNHHNHCDLYLKMMEEQNSKMLKNHNNIKPYLQIFKKSAPSKLVQDKALKRSRTDEDLPEYESGILIVNEKETPKEADGKKGNRGSERRRTFTSSDKVFN